MFSREQLRVDGTWLSTIGACGDLSWSGRWAPGGAGPYEASWRMDLPAKFTHPALRRGKYVEIKIGVSRPWFGELREPKRGADGWEFSARGIPDVLGSALCLNASLDTTSKPNTAVDQAIARGNLPITRPNTLSSTAYSDADITDKLNRVRDLLDAWADEEGLTWGVRANGEVFAEEDPTEPDYYMIPGSGVLGIADDDFASALYGRYRSTSTLAYETVELEDDTAIANFGRVEHPADLSALGPISAARAGNKLQGLINKGKARLGWTNTLEPSIYQITTSRGVPVDPRFIREGQMIRLFGVTDESRAATSTIDIVIQEYVCHSGATRISLAPKGLADRVLSDVLTARRKSA